MGLLDILNGMQNGPRGPSEPSAPGESSGGMSPMTMAILALLAWKAPARQRNVIGRTRETDARGIFIGERITPLAGAWAGAAELEREPYVVRLSPRARGPCPR